MAVYTADYYVRPTNGSDANAGTPWAAAFKTLQKALDTVPAGKVIGCAAEAEEILTASIDDDTNSGSATAGTIKIVGLNAAGERDGTRYVINANSAAASCVIANNTAYKKFINIQFKNATSHGFSFETDNPTAYFFENCIFSNNGGSGFFNAVANAVAAFYNCQFNNNSGNGVGASNTITLKLHHCSVFLNGGAGILSSTAIATIIDCLIYRNTGNGISAISSINHIHGNIINRNAIGISATSTGGLLSVYNRITNNTVGIAVTTGNIQEDYNYYYNNGTKFTVTTGKIESGVHSVDMAGDGYVDEANNNYALIAGASPASGRWVSNPYDSTNTDYTNFGLSPNPDFPAVGNTLIGDTVDGVNGTSANLTAADTVYQAREAERNISAGAGNILDTATEKIAGEDIAGTYDHLKIYTAANEIARNTATVDIIKKDEAVILLGVADTGEYEGAIPAPTKPTLTGINISANQNDLTWTPSRYTGWAQVFRSLDGGAWAQLGADLYDVAEYSDTSVIAGHTYEYKVTLASSSGSNTSDTITVEVETVSDKIDRTLLPFRTNPYIGKVHAPIRLWRLCSGKGVDFRKLRQNFELIEASLNGLDDSNFRSFAEIASTKIAAIVYQDEIRVGLNVDGEIVT